MNTYEQGFIDKCAEYNVNPEELLKVAARGDQIAKLIQKAFELNTRPGSALALAKAFKKLDPVALAPSAKRRALRLSGIKAKGLVSGGIRTKADPSLPGAPWYKRLFFPESSTGLHPTYNFDHDDVMSQLRTFHNNMKRDKKYRQWTNLRDSFKLGPDPLAKVETEGRNVLNKLIKALPSHSQENF